MYRKIICWLAIGCVCASPDHPPPTYPPPKPVYHPKPIYHEPKYEHPRPYHYAYGVKDEYAGTNFEAAEDSDGKAVSGHYSVLLPDGRRQNVKYTADHYAGYIADVSYEGHAAPYHPVKPKHTPYHPSPAHKLHIPAPYHPVPVHKPAPVYHPSPAPIYHPKPIHKPIPVHKSTPIYHSLPVHKPGPVYHPVPKPAPVYHPTPVYKPAPIYHPVSKPTPVYKPAPYKPLKFRE